MKYLCLICAEKVMEQMPRADADKHFEEYREFTDGIRKSGHYLGCNRLLPPEAASTVRVRNGRVSITDGPWIETKAASAATTSSRLGTNEAIQVASRIPGRSSDASRYGRSRAILQTLHALGAVAPETAC